MTLPITSLVALPLVLLLIGLSFRVAALRMRNRVGLGTGSNKTLAKAIAAHGNAVENIPVAIVLLAMAELQKGNTLFLIICGVTFIIARCMNAIGVSRHTGNSVSRFYGIIFSWIIIITLAAYNVWLGLL